MAYFSQRPDEFKPEIETWSAYIERMELLFDAHDVDDEKKVPMLLSSVGAVTYGLLRNLVQPEKPKDKTFAQIVDTLKDYYEPKPLVIAERFRYRKCVQKSNQTVTEYAAELRHLAAMCDFGDRLDEALRDGFVSGVSSEACQRKLLSEDRLTFARAVELAVNMETAHRDTQQLRKGDDVTASVHKVKERQRRRSPSKQEACYRCKGKNHNANDCYYKNAKCHKCERIGHIQKACRSGPARENKHDKKGKRGSDRREGRMTGYVQTDKNDDDDADILTVFSTSGTGRQPYKAVFDVNGKKVLMEIDTGSGMSIISEDVYKQSFPHVPLEGSRVKLKGYSGEPIPVKGQFMAKVAYENQTASLPLIVVGVEGPSLCGREWLDEIKLNWKMIKAAAINTVTENSAQKPKSIPEVLSKYDDVFKDELGTLKDIKATISVKPDAVPKFHKARVLPFAMKEKVEKELERLEKEGVISPVKHSEWAAPIVPVSKRDGGLRLCGDYKVTVNLATNTETYPLPRIEEVLAATMWGKKIF